MKKYLTALLLALSIIVLPSATGVQAQSGTDDFLTDGNSRPRSTCVKISETLRYRMRDSNSHGQVTKLQDFLQYYGFLNTSPTGYFGLVTLEAVKSFQRSVNISPLGVVGPLTRAKIKEISCSGIGNPISVPPPVQELQVRYPNGGESFTTGATEVLKWIDRGVSNSGVDLRITNHIVCITAPCPSLSLLIATNVFSNNYQWMVGDSQSDDSIPDGDYYLQVCRANSNVCDESDNSFRIRGGSSVGQPVISGLTAPTALQVGETGTWSVLASDPENGSLSYSVDWGESNANFTPAAQSPVVQQSTFTHVYNTAGTFTVSFTVTDNTGLTARTTTTVTVGGSVGVPILTAMPDSSSAPSTNLTPGQSNVSLASIKISVSGGGSAQISQVSIGINPASNGTAVQNLRLYDGTTLLGSLQTLPYEDQRYQNVWWGSITIPTMTVAAGSNKVLTIKGDISPSASGTFRAGIVGLVYQGQAPRVSSFSGFGNVMTVRAVAEPSISISLPAGGENWLAGTVHRISWTTGGGLDGNHYLGISVANLETSATIMSGTVLASSGYLDWSIPQGVSTGPYRVMISDAAYTPGVRAASQTFTISTPVTIGACTDSDGGRNADVAGLTDGRVNGLGTYFSDVSVGSNGGVCTGTGCTSVAEGYCDAGGQVTNILTSCSSGYSKNGACAPKPIVNPASITILSPNGGESITKGQTYKITWNSKDVSQVYIKLRKGTDTYNGTEGAVSPTIANTGYYNWTVPTTLPDGSDYGIRVIDSASGTTDDSNALFTITSGPILPPTPQLVTVVAPSGGTFTRGTSQTTGDFLPYRTEVRGASGVGSLTHYITKRNDNSWASDINYFVSSGSGFNPAVQNPISDGGSIQLNSSFAAGLYYFMSKWTSGAQTLMDFSDTPFTISNVVTQPSITVNSPNGGTFERYQPLVVSWNQSVAGKVFAEIRHESGTVSYPLANADYTAGIHSVTFDTSSIVGKFSANVSLTSAGGASVYDSSDSLFEIVQPPTPLLIAPTNPTSVVAGTPLKIQWSSSNPRITSVSLELRQYVSQCPMGSNCAAAPSTIIASTLSPTGEYTWTVPTPTPTQNTVSYRVIVCSNVRGCAGSSAFSITAPVVAQPSITITTPMGGENWPTGSIRRFSWTLGGGLDGNHYLGVSVTNVSTSAVVMSGTVLAGFGYLDWAVPQGVPSGSYRVTISDPLYTPTVSATSQPFTIGTTVVSPTITVTEPMNSYYAPQNVAVVWSSTGVIRVKIEVCHNSATTCTLVNANVPVTTAPSRYVWYVDVAGSYVGKNDVQAKVTDLDSGVSALGPVIRILAPVVVATGKPLACGMKGDVNGDGVISQADADAVRAHVLATTLLSSSAQLNADVNADGAVSTIDVSLITQYALGTTTTFPVCTSVTPTITVTQPFNSYYAPQNVAIVWSSTGVSRVKIEACYNTRATCVLVNGNVPVTAASSNYLWYLDTAASYVGKTDVQVKVTDLDSAAFGFGPAIQILAPVVTPTFDYSLGANANLTVTQGSTAANNITRTLLTGSAQAVTLTASGLPTGAAATFSNNPCVATCGSTLAITTSPTTPVGIYTITVTGQPLSKMTTFTFTVSTPTAPLLPISYSVTTDKLSYLQTEPISITIKAENPNSVSKTLNWNSGCQVGYAVAAYDSVTGQICTANLTSVTIPAYGSKTWTITHDPARYKIPAGVQTFTGKVIGYGSATVAVKISAPPVITAASASATLVDTSTDRVSSGTFGPGHANNQNPYDWHWKAEFALPAPKNVLGIVIPRKLTNILVSHPSLVESWSTLNTAYYPLVVVKGGTQVNSSYGAVIGDYTSSGSYALDLYGQPEYTSWLGGTVKFVFSDDTSVTGTIPASSIKQVSPVAFEGGTYVSASVIESFLSLLQDLK